MGFSIHRKPDFGYTVFEAFKMLYASLYCDLTLFFDVPIWARNLPVIGNLQEADVITTETVFNLLSGLFSQLSALISIESLVGIGGNSGGDEDQQSLEE